MSKTALPTSQTVFPHLIELRLWRQFAAVADTLHFGQAAIRLHMTQPPLTQAIALLERTLGVRLFDRTKRSVQLTSAGATLLPTVLDLLARAQALPAQALAAAQGEVGRLRLGFVSTVGFALLPQWVRGFRALYPKVQLDLLEATGDVQLQGLEQGELDAGFMLHAPGFAPAGLARCLITQEPLVLALPEQHPMSTRPMLRLDDVLAEPLVIFPRRIAPSFYDGIFALYHGAGYLPVIAQEAIQMQTIVNLVSAGLGVAWVPETMRQFQRSGVVYREVQVPRKGPGGATGAMPRCETSLIWSAHRVSPTLSRFVAYAHDQLG
jgi:DNA-binding transcriptional LysR family regulator